MKFLNIVKSEIIENEANNDFFIVCLFLFSRKKIHDESLVFRLPTILCENIDVFGKVKLFKLGELKIIKQNKKTIVFEFKPNQKYSNILLSKDFHIDESSFNNEEIRTMIKGLFIIKGYVSGFNSKFYHFEIRTNYKFEQEVIINVFNQYEINLKKQIKNNNVILYVKKATEISDILKIMNCDKSLMIFEDERISRSITSSYQRIEKVEDMNNKKTIEISNIQIKYIILLKEKNRFDLLSESEKAIADIRLKYPMYSLSDLAYVFNLTRNENYSKSTINNWLKNIVAKAKSVEGNVS